MVERIDQMLAVRAAEALPGRVEKDLRTRMRALPTMIQTSGLAATCAFLLSRAKRADTSDPYYRTAVAVLRAAAEAVGITPDNSPHETLTRLASATGHQYLLAETRARELASWLSRLAQARYTPEPGSSDGDEPEAGGE